MPDPDALCSPTRRTLVRSVAAWRVPARGGARYEGATSPLRQPPEWGTRAGAPGFRKNAAAGSRNRRTVRSARLPVHATVPREIDAADRCASGSALFLDLDGTLVEIADHPDAICIAPGLADTLAALRDRLGGALAVITGRRSRRSTGASRRTGSTSRASTGPSSGSEAGSRARCRTTTGGCGRRSGRCGAALPTAPACSSRTRATRSRSTGASRRTAPARRSRPSARRRRASGPPTASSSARRWPRSCRRRRARVG